MYDEFFAKSNELMQQGVPFATVTVIRAERPTSAKPGDKAIITVDGLMHGWVGGSCAQPTVIKEALKAMAEEESRLIRLSVEPESQRLEEGRIELPMTCFSGGMLEIFIEPQPPRPRLLIVGNLPVARALAHLGRAMSYHVSILDLDGGATVPHADEVLNTLDGIESQIRSNTYVVIATHGYYDELALEKILRARPGYVGLVASRSRAESVREYLRAQGITEEELFPLKAPAGLDIRARRGDEIALSIMAEIVRKRRSASLVDLSLFEDDVEKGASAIDPVCGMQVDIATAKYMSEYEGDLYYFCCASCQSRFMADPDSFLEQPAPSGTAIDPICQMTVEIATAKYMSEYEGDLYYFCCPGCKRAFDRAPERYISGEAVGEGSHGE